MCYTGGMLEGLTRDALHHAYVINAPVKVCGTLVGELEVLLATPLATSPDVLAVQAEALTTEEARRVVEFATRSPMVPGGEKVILLTFTSAGIEAQNVLLKTLEEPPVRTHIFILTPSASALLPTVRSRCVMLDAHVQQDLPLPTDILKEIERLHKRKDTAGMTELLDTLEVHIAKSGSTDAKRALVQAREYWHDKGAMRKMLLESVALMLS